MLYRSILLYIHEYSAASNTDFPIARQMTAKQEENNISLAYFDEFVSKCCSQNAYSLVDSK